ncbi:lactonase family protein [Limnovirga soli]|uniref:Beta-propeller fold lactonase family protein n=1 Tax=Limnovirga soli TaxID=2656915 RepID=A0A8J8FFA6_9BACT|nr:lactonase family protein [Limnovirga soli]NNV56397.1 beta-propeller fold lactonase family protein [Limnovirga soli]
MKKVLLVIALLNGMVAFAQNPIQYLLVGTYTNSGKSEGIYVYRFNPNKTEATLVSVAKGVQNPSYLAISKDQKFVYAVNENHGDNGGDVSAFSLDKTKGELTFLNKQPSGGDDPCYVAIDSTGKNVVVANYSGGNVSVLKTNADGSLKPVVQNIMYDGYGVNVTRQEMPHPHSTVFSNDEKNMFVPNLGNDRLYRYTFNANDAANPLTPMDPPYYEIPDNSGPRHITFHPNGKYVYLVNELSGNVIVYANNNGVLTEIQTIISDNTNSKTDKGSADIHITPDGKFLYTTNRATANDIAMFKVGTDGKLTENGHQAVGMHPRNFMIDPTGRFLLVANRDSNSIQIFIINKNFGILQDSGVKIDVPQPVCLKMVPVK